MNRPGVLVVAASAVALLPATARATYSIVATDRTTGEVGGAVTSCVGSQGVGVVYRPSVGHGGVNAQATANATGRDRAVTLLNMDVAPADIISMITASSFDSRAATRQYGVVDLMGRAAGFTGSSAMNYKEDRQGTIGAHTYSVQGNILTSKAVIDQAETAFRNTGCDLADKLMLALEGGATGGEGDSRCTPQGIPSDAASIEVDRTGETAGAYLKLSVAGTGNTSAVVRLRAMFDSWRATHACGGGTGGAGGGAGAGGRGGAGGSAGGRGGADGSSDARGGAGGTTAGRGGAGGASGRGGAGDGGGGVAGSQAGAGAASGAAGSGGGAAGSGGGAGGTEPGDDSGGCSCHASGRGARSFGFVALAAGLSLLLRRTRRRRVRPRVRV